MRDREKSTKIAAVLDALFRFLYYKMGRVAWVNDFDKKIFLISSHVHFDVPQYIVAHVSNFVSKKHNGSCARGTLIPGLRSHSLAPCVFDLGFKVDLYFLQNVK